MERPNPVRSRPLTIAVPPAEEGPLSATSPRVTISDGERVLFDLYVGLIEHAAVQIGELFTGLVEDDGVPAVFHCHAGKDRTGIVAALLLEALGVRRDIVLDDYELTARYRLRNHQESSYERLIELGLSPEAAAGVLTAPRWAMQQALEDLDHRYGSVEPYLTGRRGCVPSTCKPCEGGCSNPPTETPAHGSAAMMQGWRELRSSDRAGQGSPPLPRSSGSASGFRLFTSTSIIGNPDGSRHQRTSGDRSRPN